MRIAQYIFFLIIFSFAFISCNNCRYGCENGFCQKSECNCYDWWEGDACERSVLSKYSGKYVGSENCEGVSLNISFEMNVDVLNPSILNTDIGYDIRFTDQTRFEVYLDSVGTDFVIGNGEMLLNRISFNLTKSDSVSSKTCLIEAIYVE